MAFYVHATVSRHFLTSFPLPPSYITRKPRRHAMHDTSILRHAFMLIFITLWAVISHYVTILMAILSYFIRFIMKRENAGSWDSGWKRSKYWKPILHSSKSLETPRKSFLELIRIIEQRKYQRGPTPWPRGWGHTPPSGRTPCLVGPLVALRCPSSAI